MKLLNIDESNEASKNDLKLINSLKLTLNYNKQILYNISLNKEISKNFKHLFKFYDNKKKQ